MPKILQYNYDVKNTRKRVAEKEIAAVRVTARDAPVARDRRHR
jgi:hypothetical protein